MTIGQGGKYDDECAALLVTTRAEATVVMVCNGNRGSGFSASIMVSRAKLPAVTRLLINAMRSTADQMEADLARMQAEQSGGSS